MEWNAETCYNIALARWQSGGGGEMSVGRLPGLSPGPPRFPESSEDVDQFADEIRREARRKTAELAKARVGSEKARKVIDDFFTEDKPGV
jgi:hypothetical protein